MKRSHGVLEEKEESTTMTEKGLPPSKELIEAVLEGQAELVKTMLESTAYDVNMLFDHHEKYEDNFPVYHKARLLHLAAAHGRAETVSVLVRVGADVNTTCEVSWWGESYSKTALGCAILGSHLNVFIILLQAGSDVNQDSHFYHSLSCSPLSLVVHQATDPNSKLTFNEQKEMIKLLVEAGADFRRKGHWEKTVLFQMGEQIEKLELLEWALSNSKEEGGIDFASLLETRDQEGRTPLYHAVQKVNCAARAYRSHWENVVSLLLRFGADPNAKRLGLYVDPCERSLFFFLLRSSQDMAKLYRLLLDHGGDEAELLHSCCSHQRRHSLVESMLKIGCRVVNAKNDDGLFPFQVVALRSTCDSENTSLTTLFLLLRADPSVLVPE